jgi:hypothetical protein
LRKLRGYTRKQKERGLKMKTEREKLEEQYCRTAIWEIAAITGKTCKEILAMESAECKDLFVKAMSENETEV